MTKDSAKNGEKGAKTRFRGLRSVMVLFVIGATVLASLLSATVYFVGRHIAREALRDTQLRKTLSESELSDFEQFVAADDVNSTDSKRIDEWTQSRDASVSLIIRKRDRSVLLYTSSGTFRELENVAALNDSSVDSFGAFRDVRFRDGTFPVAFYVSYRPVYVRELLTATFLTFFFTLSVVLVVCNGHYLRKIRSLSSQTAEVSGGNLDKVVSLKSNDEFGALANDIDAMRRALVERIQSEGRAWEANSELITSISHDIRTPLTTLLAYSEILANGQYSSREQLQQYSEICRRKSYQLKDMTDQLFSYFLLFGQENLRPQLKQVSVCLFVEQAVLEAAAPYTVESDGSFRIRYDLVPDDGSIADIDVLMFCRVLDNVFFNIEKYADVTSPVAVLSRFRNGGLEVRFVNRIREDRDSTAGTKVGLRTCARLCEAMEIAFEAGEENGEFQVIMTIPVRPAEGAEQ